ncbi:MAG: hypothetical protein PWP46_132 [Fusobacteriaceae bacterium]|jgi:tetratricopeptide (TPR) repeat protein|nr:hypothetical protein [Fusobacteriales bacterium]MDN5303253.1 hypothetical protein [Fusobacteriaceae bacterium]
MKRILLFIMLLFSTISYSKIDISGVNFVNTPITLVSQTKGKWYISGKPTYSKGKLIDNGYTATFIPDTIGTFEITFESKNGEKEINIFEIKSINQFDENKIYDIITESFNSKNLKLLEYGINLLELNFPNSKYINPSYKKAIELSKLDNNFETGLNYLNKLNSNFIGIESEYVDLLTTNYLFYDFFNKTELKIEVLKKLIKYNKNYEKELFITYFNDVKYHNLGLKNLEKYFFENFDIRVANILANYYEKNKNYEKAAFYYSKFNNFLAAKNLLLADKDYSKYLELLSENEKKELASLEENKKDKNRYIEYYKYAQENISKERFELAEIYLKRVLTQSNNNNLKKQSAIDLISIYNLKYKYNNALDIYNNYLKELISLKDIETYYNIGLIYYKLNDKENSLKIFNDIIKKYPKTIWATKSSIYKIRLQKI